MTQADGPLSAHEVKFISKHENDNKRGGRVSEMYCIARLGRAAQKGE